MVSKIKKAFRRVSIDLLVYGMTADEIIPMPEMPYKVLSEEDSKGRKKYFIIENGQIIHSSLLFRKLNVLRLVSEKGPAIGDCVTIPEYKGKSIYPFVIRQIAAEILLSKQSKKVFILVHPENTSSIRGIEKAGFRLLAKITAKRFFLFYYDVKIQK